MLLLFGVLQLLVVAGPGDCQEVTAGTAAEYENLESVVERQGQLIDQLQAQLNALTQRVARQEEEVAFNVRFSHPHGPQVPMNESHVLVFDHADLNLGRGYHTSTGVFDVPISGLYLFSLKIAHTPPGNIHVQIVRDGVSVAEVEANGDDRYIDRSTTDVVLRLSEGQQVWTEWISGTATQVEGALRSSFLGVLLKGE